MSHTHVCGHDINIKGNYHGYKAAQCCHNWGISKHVGEKIRLPSQTIGKSKEIMGET